MSKQSFSKAPYLVVTTASLTLLASNVFSSSATNNSNGVPNDLYTEIQVVEQQITDTQNQISDFQDYVQSTSSDLFDISSQLCFDSQLDLEAALGLGATGDLHASLATGVDIYGLINLDAGAGLQAALDAAVQLGAGVHGRASFCLNMGVLKVDDQGNVTSPLSGLASAAATPASNGVVSAAASPVSSGVNALLPLVQDGVTTATSLLEQIPDLVDKLDIGPLSLSDGLATAENLFQHPGDLVDGLTALGTQQGRDQLETEIASLPGGSAIAGALDGIFSSFQAVENGDICGAVNQLGDIVSGSLGSALGSACGFLADHTVNTLTSAVTHIYTTLNTTIDGISGVLNSVHQVVEDIQDKVGTIIHKIEDVASDVSSLL